MKPFFKIFFLSGLFFALFMAGFDLRMENGFNPWKFIIHLIGFGGFNAFMNRYQTRKKAKLEKAKEEKNLS